VVAREVIERLESVGDHRPLAAHEVVLHGELKLKTLGLSSLQRTITQQESRILWIKESDTPTAFFHAHANTRCQRNHIRSLRHGDLTLLSEDDKAAMIFDFFNEVLASPQAHSCKIMFEALGLPSLELSAMGTRFSKEEVWTVIKGLPSDKAPGPNGFTARFFQSVWPVIKHDVISAFDAFWCLTMQHLHNTNDAFMVLLPKTVNAKIIKDYRSIAFIHSIGKLIAKVLANRLVPRLQELVHVSQNTFIKGCFIHDSFKLVQASAKHLHVRKVPSVLLKVDIVRLFDSVS
jgi:hypothetical protein